MAPPTFKDRHPELQHLVRELFVVRENNRRFKPGDAQQGLLLFAEGALVCLALERFLRAILESRPTGDATLYNLLQMALKEKLLELPWRDQDDGIQRLKEVRNTWLHGNYEKAAANAGCASTTEYFRTQFASEVEMMFKIADNLVLQINLETGKRFTPLPTVDD